MHCLVSLLLLAVLLDSDISILRSLSPSQGYAPPYEQSVYKGAERALKVALMSLTLVRILQRVGFSGNLYRFFTGQKGCLLKSMNAVEVAWIVAVSILVQQMVTCVYAALSSINKQQRTGKEQLRGASFLRRMKNSLRALIVFTSSLFLADALGLPIKPLITSLGFVTVNFCPRPRFVICI